MNSIDKRITSSSDIKNIRQASLGSSSGGVTSTNTNALRQTAQVTGNMFSLRGVLKERYKNNPHIKNVPHWDTVEIQQKRDKEKNEYITVSNYTGTMSVDEVLALF